MDERTSRELERMNRAELAVIGAMLIDPQPVMPMLLTKLSGEDFVDATLRNLFEAGKKLYLDRKPIDPITLGAEAKVPEYMAIASEIMNITPTAANAAEYADVVRENARLRALASIGRELVNCRGVEEAQDCIDRLNRLTIERPGVRTVTMQDAVMSFLARLEERRNKGPVQYLNWGMDYITDHLDAELGDYIIIGGYPSAGKTLLAMQMVQTIAKQYRTGFYSFETKEKKLTDRMMSFASGVPLWRIKHNDLREADYRALAKASEQLYALPFSVTEAAGMTVHDVLAEALSRRQQVIFIDYLQLIHQRGDNRYEKVTEISMELHTMAQQHNIMVVALAQLTRPEKSPKEGKPVPPGMSSLRESGQLEQDADAILLLYPENPTKGDSNRILKFAKNKENEIPKPCTYAFKGEIQTFQELFPERPRSNRSGSGKKPGQNDQEELPL